VAVARGDSVAIKVALSSKYLGVKEVRMCEVEMEVRWKRESGRIRDSKRRRQDQKRGWKTEAVLAVPLIKYLLNLLEVKDKSNCRGEGRKFPTTPQRSIRAIECDVF
jgi:hypothetical protein